MKNLFLIVILLFTVVSATSQVGIGTSTPNASAMLEVSSTSKGVLLPRMTSAQMSSISTPAEGLEVYCSDCVPKGSYAYSGIGWKNKTTLPDYAITARPTIMYTPFYNISLGVAELYNGSSYQNLNKLVITSLLSSAPLIGSTSSGVYVQTSGTPPTGVSLNDVFYWSGSSATLAYSYSNADQVFQVGTGTSAIVYAKSGGSWLQNGSGGIATGILNGNSSVTAVNDSIKINTGGIGVATFKSTGLSVTGNLTVNGVSSLGSADKVNISGGSNGQMLTTNGSGTLSWTTPVVSNSGSSIGAYTLFSSSLPPSSGYLRQGTGPYNTSDYPALGAAFPAYTTPTQVAKQFPAPNNSYINSAAYGNGRWVGISNDSRTAYYSTNNGTTWTSVNTGYTSSQVGYLVWTGTVFVSIGYGAGTAANAVLISTNGTSWSLVTLPTVTGGYYGLANNGSTLIAFTEGTASVAVSTDNGSTWTLKTNVLPSSGAWEAVGYGNGTWVAMKYNTNSAAYSTNNGTSWTSVTLPVSFQAERITYGNGMFVAVNVANGTLLTSPDGITWTYRTTPIGGVAYGCAFDGSRFLITSTASANLWAAYSSTGINWTSFILSAPANNKTEYDNSAFGGNGNFMVFAAYIGGNLASDFITIPSGQFTVPSCTEPSGFQYWVKGN